MHFVLVGKRKKKKEILIKHTKSELTWNVVYQEKKRIFSKHCWLKKRKRKGFFLFKFTFVIFTFYLKTNKSLKDFSTRVE
jgi:hypothetical protein